MDLISHFLWTYILFGHVFQLDVNLGILLFFSVFPDFALLPFIYFELIHFRKYDIEKIHKMMPRFAEIGYHITHSVITLITAAFFTLIFFPKATLPMVIGWGMHIAIDLFIHKKGMQIMPLYPLSKKGVKGVVTWYKSTWFMVIDIVLLIVIFLFLFITGRLV